jgi:hypothetical protein
VIHFSMVCILPLTKILWKYISQKIETIDPTQRGMNSSIDNNFYENIYFRNLSQWFNSTRPNSFTNKFFMKIFILEIWAKWSYISWLYSFTNKIFTKIFILKIQVKWFKLSWTNSFTDKIFYKNIYLRKFKSSDTNHR